MVALLRNCPPIEQKIFGRSPKPVLSKDNPLFRSVPGHSSVALAMQAAQERVLAQASVRNVYAFDDDDAVRDSFCALLQSVGSITRPAEVFPI